MREFFCIRFLTNESFVGGGFYHPDNITGYQGSSG